MNVYFLVYLLQFEITETNLRTIQKNTNVRIRAANVDSITARNFSPTRCNQ